MNFIITLFYCKCSFFVQGLYINKINMEEVKIFVTNQLSQGLARNVFFSVFHQWSISPTVYQRICANFFAPKKNLTYTTSTKKLLAKLSYERATHKTLVKLTLGQLFDRNVKNPIILNSTVYFPYYQVINFKIAKNVKFN